MLSYLGLEEACYRRCEEYSVGMKQRLKLAAALVHDPEVLLLDEPTAGLDPDGREAMLALLQSLAARHGKSLVLSTHLLGDVDRVCDQVLIIHRGVARGVGRIGDLRGPVSRPLQAAMARRRWRIPESTSNRGGHSAGQRKLAWALERACQLGVCGNTGRLERAQVFRVVLPL